MLDTSVLVPAVLRPTGLAARILDEWLGGRFELLCSERLINELEAVLTRRATPIEGPPIQRSEGLTDVLRRASTLVAITETNRELVVRDPSDEFVLWTAIEGGADLIVSSDKDLLELGEVEGIPIVGVHDFALTLGLEH